MERAGVHAGELDIIVLGTASPDRLLPVDGRRICRPRSGATRAAAFDIGAACAGWHLRHARSPKALIAAGSAETVLVVGAETLSSIIDWTDRTTCVLFGDGAGAAVAASARTHATAASSSAYMRSDGTLADLLYRPAGGAAQSVRRSRCSTTAAHYIKMAGREVFKHAVRSMAEACDRALDGAKLTGADIDLLIPHQANIRIIEATAKHANIPMDKVYVNVDRYGNTSSASDPDRARRSDRAGRDRRKAPRCCSSRSAPDSRGARWSSGSDAWTSSCCFPGRARRSPAWARTSPTRFPRRRDAFAARGRRARRAALDALLRGAGGRADAHAQRAAGAARARRRGVGRRPRARSARRVRRRRRALAGRVHRLPRRRRADARGRRAPRAAPRRADVRERRRASRAPWPRSSATPTRPIEDICARGDRARRARRAGQLQLARAGRDQRRGRPASSARWSWPRTRAPSARSAST